jgi:hypothetical protein
MRLAIIILSLLFSLYPTEGITMSILFGKEVVLFSPIDGKITFNGAPAANAEIILSLKWKDDTGEKEIFFADAQGRFSLPLKKTKVRIPPLAEFVISQSIFVRYANQEFQIWGRTKRGVGIYDELGAKPVNFRCELTDDIDYIDVPDGLFGTACKWDTVDNREPK